MKHASESQQVKPVVVYAKKLSRMALPVDRTMRCQQPHDGAATSAVAVAANAVLHVT